MRWPMRYSGLTLFLLGFGFTTGCSGSPAESAATSAEVETADADPERLDADFMKAYREGFYSRESAPAARREASSARDTDASEIDRDFVAGYAQLTSLPVRDVESFVESGDADALLQARYQVSGLKRGELIPANVLLFVASWEAYNGSRASPEQVTGLQQQMQSLWTKGAEFELSSEGQRQRRLYELLAAVLMRENTRVRQSGDAGGIAAFRETVREDFLRQSNNDLARYTLTGDGFVER
ncbi:MAG: hypothetical protein ACTIJY_08395 [Luteimonas sp.]